MAKALRNIGILVLALALCALPALASTFVDAHGNTVELDDSLEAYTSYTLVGADGAARAAETNLGDLWADALAWFASSGAIDEYIEEDDIARGITSLAVDADHIVALWNGGNLRDSIPEGKFGAEQIAQVLPYPNKVAVIYMTGEQLLEVLEAASQGLPCTEESFDSCAAFLQVSGIRYTVDVSKEYDRGEPYGDHWFKAASLSRVTVEEVNGKPFDPEAVYAVVTHHANFNGMDSSYAVKAAAEADERSIITTAVVRDMVWRYISEQLGGIVGEEYAQPQGRIAVVGAAE